MPLTDPIADCLTRIRNAQKAKLATVNVLSSKMNTHISEILKKEGYIQSFKKAKVNEIPMIALELKYSAARMPIIREIKRISKPGCRKYSSVDELKAKGKSMATIILSTPKGLLTDREAKKENVGGELICSIM